MGTVLMKENQTSVNISVPIFNDDIPETNEVFFVELVSVELVSSGVQGNENIIWLKKNCLVDYETIQNDDLLFRNSFYFKVKHFF